MSLFDSVAGTIANQAASKYIPSSVNKAINVAGNIGGNLMNGNLLGAGAGLLNTGIFDKTLGNLSGVMKQAAYWNTSTPMFGGITPAEAKAIHQKSIATNFTKKNLFIIEVSSLLYGDISDRFNLYASEVEYSPSTITGEKRKIGSATVDSVQSSEPIDLSITTLDDSSGFIKTWFNTHANETAHKDGTIGLPFMYAIRIKIVHGVIKQSFFAYEDIGLYRPTNMSVSLTRREDGLEELTMTFSQLDTFMAV